MWIKEELTVDEIRDRAWSGARSTLKYLTDTEVELLLEMLEECAGPDGYTLTDVNDFSGLKQIG